MLNKTGVVLAPTATAFDAANILIGGGGNDLIEGKGGDDWLDGDRWLNVQLEASMENGAVKRVNNARDLIDDIFSDPQRLNPGKIKIVKEIVFTNATAANVDTAVYAGPIANYTISAPIGPPNRRFVTVTDNVGTPALGGGILLEGTDTIRGVEFLQFSDGQCTEERCPDVLYGRGA